MLNPRFKSLYLMFYFNGHDQQVTIIEQYDTMSLYHMFMKC
jgi:hypothetical protein